MSILATFYETHCEVIAGTEAERKQFLEDIRPSDRTWNEFKGCWVVRNIYRYQRLPYIHTALAARPLQPKLPFGE